MSLDYSVSELVGDDLERDLEDFLLSLENLSPTENLTLDHAKEILSKINLQNGHIYVAKTSEGNIIGATTLLVEQKFIHGGGRVGHIEDVSVRKGHEGRGVGSSLVKRALDEARIFGCYKVILDCSDENIPFYERLGFYLQEKEMRFDIR